MSKRSIASIGCLLVVVLFWTALTAAFDVYIGYNIYRQMEAQRYPTVGGIVLRSQVQINHSSDGTTYAPDIEYEYTVGGTTLQAQGHRFGQWSTGRRDPAEDIVRRFPVGAAVTVFYDPAEPHTSVLETGVQGMDLFLLLFMTPFNVVMLAGWCVVGAGVWRLRRGDPDAVHVIEERDGCRVRLPPVNPFGAAGGVAAALSFVFVFAVGIFTGFAPPLVVIQLVWVVVLVAAVGTFAWYTAGTRSGRYDLVFDDVESTVTLPEFEDHERLKLDRDQLRGGRVQHRSKGSGENKRSEFVVAAVWHDGVEEQITPFARYSAQPEAKRLATWFDARIGG